MTMCGIKISMMYLLKDLINLAPRKPDWDLKRDVAKKLEKLEKKTQRAIAELISKCCQNMNVFPI